MRFASPSRGKGSLPCGKRGPFLDLSTWPPARRRASGCVRNDPVQNTLSKLPARETPPSSGVALVSVDDFIKSNTDCERDASELHTIQTNATQSDVGTGPVRRTRILTRSAETSYTDPGACFPRTNPTHLPNVTEMSAESASPRGKEVVDLSFKRLIG